MAFCFAALCNAALRILPQRFSSCHVGFFVLRHWHVLCHGIGDHIARLAMALVTAFHHIGCCILCCATAFPLSRALQHPGLFRTFLFSPESGASDAQFWIFLHIKMPLSGAPFLDVPLFYFLPHQDATFQSAATHTTFWKFPLLLRKAEQQMHLFWKPFTFFITL